MTNQHGIEIKGIRQHFLCGHYSEYQVYPELDPKVIERVSLTPDDFVSFTDLTEGECFPCRMNAIGSCI